MPLSLPLDVTRATDRKFAQSALNDDMVRRVERDCKGPMRNALPHASSQRPLFPFASPHFLLGMKGERHRATNTRRRSERWDSTHKLTCKYVYTYTHRRGGLQRGQDLVRLSDETPINFHSWEHAVGHLWARQHTRWSLRFGPNGQTAENVNDHATDNSDEHTSTWIAKHDEHDEMVQLANTLFVEEQGTVKQVTV